ncbi:DUF3656 domain-containing U32 family peptidase [Alkalithermobacter paradoxus]|uniref:Putative protease YdcP n=1 Tax=Alkalithermobacter paradoxus TaxID=29349 RepID=A0A1V4I6E0_9FIRM|nr:putative protease YdcP precursor [[Clostridium] thermoalcaliphilum]
MNTELLAPVGSFDSLKAAVQNGADAVYLGGKEFSARASASNFDRENLKKAVEYAHIRDVKVYVALNTLIKESEIERCIEYVKYLYDIDVDAIILQDIGIASIIKENFPDFEIHASTQMVAHSIEDVKYLEDMGFSRVVLARELTIDEINYICNNTSVDIEIFVHGALCVCYSGQCLMSSMIGGRSGNRGRCAQPCRMEYDLVDLNTLSRIDVKGKYLLSPKDLNTIENLDKVIKSKVLSLKIEGRMKRPEYVATVVSAYREALDNYIKNKDMNVKKEVKDDLYSIFNRKFTGGYILGNRGKEIMNPQKPNNIGLYIGKVLDYDKKAKRLTIKLENTLRKGDGINLGGGIIGRILIGDKILDEAHSKSIIKLDFTGNAKKGQEVYKTLDSHLLDKARKSYENDIENKKINIQCNITLKLDDYPKLRIVDNRKNEIIVISDKKVEKAIKIPIDDEKIKKQLSKLGNTPYTLENINIQKDDDISIPVSILNEMRRSAIEKLDNKRKKLNQREDVEIRIDEDAKTNKAIRDIKIRIKIKSIDVLKEIINEDIDLIYYEDSDTLKEAIEICKSKNKNIAYSLPRIVRNDQYKIINKVFDENIENIQVCNIGSINKFKDKVNMYGDYSLNVFNSNSIKHLKNKGLKAIAISPELNIYEIGEVLKNSQDIDVEGIVYGRIPLMISEYCPLGTLTDNCNRGCKNKRYGLRDSRGEIFPISKDEFCRGIIYNSKILCVVDELEKIIKSGINVLRLDFTLEEVKEIKDIVKMYTSVVKNDFEVTKEYLKVYEKLKDKGITNGHYFRGVE